MKLLKDKIIAEGVAKGTEIVKVDKFLNHQVDPFLLREIGKKFYNRFKDDKITKILTIESSGIAIAAFVALEFGVPFVFAKKYNSRNLDNNVYQADVYSFTKCTTSTIRVSKNYIDKNDRVLVIDDFLANGCALKGLINVIEQGGATVCGCGIVIEKSFQPGADEIKKMGYRVESLARIESINDGNIKFLE